MIFHALLIAAPSPDRVTGPTLFPSQKSIVEKPGCLALNPANFSIKVSGAMAVGSAGSVLKHGVARYSKLITSDVHPTSGSEYCVCPAGPLAALPSLEVTVPTGMPYAGIHDESYSISVDGAFATLEAESVWGAMRGLETFSQMLVTSGGDGGYTGSVVCAASVTADFVVRDAKALVKALREGSSR
jgi:hypothetical protein